MLLGEHAVLDNNPAIVGAVNKRLQVILTPDYNSKAIKISDPNLGSLEQGISDLNIQTPFQFVLSAILLFKDRLPTGFSLQINAEFSSVMGFGSSAAVTAATVAVIANWLDGKPLSNKKVFLLAKRAILQVQVYGSGADLAASIYGGVLYYKVKPLQVIPLSLIPDLTAVYCGYKMPTPTVINIVNLAKQKQPQIYASVFKAISTCVKQAVIAIKQADWEGLGKIFNQHHGLQSAIGTSNALLDDLRYKLNAEPQILGAKISGSGLGDCVIGLGALQQQIFPQDNAQQEQGIMQLPISIDSRGLLYVNY